jgi:hypothetical protein
MATVEMEIARRSSIFSMACGTRALEFIGLRSVRES